MISKFKYGDPERLWNTIIVYIVLDFLSETTHLWEHMYLYTYNECSLGEYGLFQHNIEFDAEKTAYSGCQLLYWSVFKCRPGSYPKKLNIK